MESQQQKLQPNPHENTNFLSKIFFIWTIPLFKKGYSKILQIEDMFHPLKRDHSALLGDRLDEQWRHQLRKKSGHPSIVKAVALTFWREYAIIICMTLFGDIVFRLAQPLLLGELLRYFREDSQISNEQAFWCAGGILAMFGFTAIFTNHTSSAAIHNGSNIRIAIGSIFYRKALRLSQTALGETPPGKMINLLSTDINSIVLASSYINFMWTSPITLIFVKILLFREIGYPALIGITIIGIVVPLQSYMGKLSSKFRLQASLRTDERVRFMDEIISGVQVIKMYAWEKPFSKLISVARKSELKIVRRFAFLRGLFCTLMLFQSRLAIFCTMISMVLIYGADEITATKVFVMTSYFGIIAQTMGETFSRGVVGVTEALVGFRRIQSFLLLDEKTVENNDDVKGRENNGMAIESFETSKKMNGTDNLADKNLSVVIENATAFWTVPESSFELNSSESYKSLHEDDKMAWKTPTLSNISVEFPKGKLIGIIGPVGSGKSSFLQALLRELPFESGSMSINGSISYASQEPWVFAASIRQNILFGEHFDRNRYNAVVKTCALTQDFQQFENGDLSVVGDRGVMLSGGQKARISLARACYRKTDIYLLDDPLSAVDAHVGTHIYNKCIGPKGRLVQLNATRILVTHQVHFLKKADWLVILRDGKIEAQGTPANLSKSGVDFAQLIGNDEMDAKNEESTGRRTSRRISTYTVLKEEIVDESTKCIGMEESSRGKVKGSLAGNYFKAGGNWFSVILVLFSFVLAQLLASSADYWVSVWVGQEEMRQNHNHTSPPTHSFTLTTDQCMIIHGSIVVTLVVIAIMRSIGFFEMAVRASQKLHNAMFNGLVFTSMRFFDINPSGRILNRFAKDIGGIDELLPKSIFSSTQVILDITGAIVVATTVSPFFLIPVAIMGIIFIFVLKGYLRTSRNIKRLEGMAKSPVYTHLSATLNGLSTIRAFNAEKTLGSEFDRHQDTHTACWYLFVSTNAAFGITVDLMCNIFITCIMCYFMFTNKNVPGEKVGLALTQAMGLLGLLRQGIIQSAEVTNQLMSVERVLEYRDLKPEKQPEYPFEVSADWPATGKIELRNLVYRYYAEGEPVLRDLSLNIQPKEKIGIVGRTGAGKSSLIGAIFRIACIEGNILIDGIDTATIHLNDLRKRIAVIPQDPVLFSGTLRRNLDPFEEHPDDEIWSALEKVELKEVASGPLGLHSSVMARGANYSVGQRQLLCLARAILRKNRILVLDEATANIDPQTDVLIQRTIREKFAECTVLTVAHRLNTIIDSDRVLVMDAGRVAEFDEPHKLLQNQSGIFYGMVSVLGSQEFRRLCELAREKFNHVHNGDVENTRL